MQTQPDCITVYQLQTGQAAAKLSRLLVPFEAIKRHMQRKGYWRDTAPIIGYDGYAQLGRTLYGFKIIPQSCEQTR